MEVLVVPAAGEQLGGQEVIRKIATLPDERARLLREAEVLRMASERRVDGMATVLEEPSDEDAEPCMITSAVAGPSLAAAVPLPALEVAGVAAEVARLLAGLHEAGLVHGAVEPSHVVLDGAGGVILVGLGHGGPAGAPSLEPSAGALDPAADVAAWGMLVGHLLDWSAASADEPLVALRRSLATRKVRRGGSRPAPPQADEDERRVLAALADQAQDPDPARRPSARSLGVAVTHRLPAARVPGAVAVATAPAAAGGLLSRLAAHVPAAEAVAVARATNQRSARADDGAQTAEERTASAQAGSDEGGERRGAARSRGRTPTRKAGRGRGAVLDRSGAASPDRSRRSGPKSPPAKPTTVARSGPPPGEAVVDAGSATAARPPVVRAGRRWAVLAGLAVLAVVVVPPALRQLPSPQPSPAGVGSTVPTSACAPVERPAADVDGDGCEEPVRWSDGVLQAGTARFALGASGDAWAVGDWDCDGRRTPALLHHGALAVFDAWPAPGGELHGHQVANAAGAAAITVVPGPDGCDRPLLQRPGASDLVVDPRRRP